MTKGTTIGALPKASLTTRIHARVLRHDAGHGLSTPHFSDGELRVPMVSVPLDTAIAITIDARDVSIALSRPMDVSIINRLPGAIVDLSPLRLPFVLVTLNLGVTDLISLVTQESVERLALEPGLRAWAMIKTVAIGKETVSAEKVQQRRGWTLVQNQD